ncbi:MAG: PP2C family protein-serine/threonine phosphatase [Vicinamibacteria bacterium]|nr:PP2C family protein-serine/threonine phosphatase [Vicinamibacteria bacterium]
MKGASELALLLAALPVTSSDEAAHAATLELAERLTGASSLALFAAEGEGLRLRAARGVAAREASSALRLETAQVDEPGPLPLGLDRLLAVRHADRLVGALGIGGGDADAPALPALCGLLGERLGPQRADEEVRRLNQRLSVKVFQLKTLFEITRELAASGEEAGVVNVALSTLMGHLVVSRAALYLASGEGLTLAGAKGVRSTSARAFSAAASAPLLALLERPTAVEALPPGEPREALAEMRLATVIPLRIGARPEGFFAIGPRISGAPASDEDLDFAATLGQQALAALDTLRLQRVRLSKERQDRELQIAREIQGSLFPRGCPRLPGYELAAASDSCYEVGGDLYDYIPLPEGRLALAVADISGKGTPASLLMASLHASLRALAGSLPIDRLMARLNRFLCESTSPSKYVTLFYAELDPASGRLQYASAGHVPPFLLRADGGVTRLDRGAPVLGLLEDIDCEVGELQLVPGDVIAAVTDGATEAQDAGGNEWGDDRLVRALQARRGQGAVALLSGVVEGVRSWTGAAGCTDDLTVLVLKATER